MVKSQSQSFISKHSELTQFHNKLIRHMVKINLWKRIIWVTTLSVDCEVASAFLSFPFALVIITLDTTRDTHAKSHTKIFFCNQLC